MAVSDFNENDYQNRSAGLQAWLNGVGNATPASPAYPDQQAQPSITPMQAFMAGQVAQQKQKAQDAGFDTSEVNSDQTQPPNQDNPGPYAVAGALSKDSFSGGQSSQPQQAPAANSSAAPSALQSFMDSGPMSFLAGGSPFFKGLKDSADNVAAAKAIQNIPSNNDPAIATLQQQAMADPTNGRQYASALSQYMANTQNPEARTRTEESGMDLAQKKLAMQKFQAGMAAAAADAPAGSGQAAPIAIPQADGSSRGQQMPSIKSVAGAMNTMPNNAVLPVGGSAASPPPLPMGIQPAPASVIPAQPMTPQQQHIELLRQQAAQGLIPYADYVKAKDPTNPDNIPKQTNMNGVVFTQNPGEAPKPYAVPPMNKSGAQVTADGTILPTQKFGSTLSPRTTDIQKTMVENDKAGETAAQQNRPIISNSLRILDSLEPNFDSVNTGTGAEYMGNVRNFADTMTKSAVGANIPYLHNKAIAQGNIEKGTNDLAVQLIKFQTVPGAKGNKITSQAIMNSKPGMQYAPEVNKNMTANLRSQLNSADISGDIDQQYRALSPYGTTDQNTRDIDDSLKTLYPIDGHVGSTTTFSQENADKIRSLIPDAIANPSKYIDAAKKINMGIGTPYDPTKAADNNPAGVTGAQMDIRAAAAAELARRGH